MNFNDLNMKWSFECVTIHETWNIYDPLTWVYDINSFRSEVAFAYIYRFDLNYPHKTMPHQRVQIALMDIDLFMRSAFYYSGFFKDLCNDLRSKILYGMWNLREDYGHGKVF